MMKKLALLFFALSMAANTWAYSFASGGIYYNITSSTAPYTASVTCATGSFNSYSGTVTIPDSVTNAATKIKYAVTSIDIYAFRYCTDLTTINIPSSVISIGEGAFEGCTRLTTINIPSSVTSIGDYAFSGCTGLTTMIIPSSVISIGEYAFKGCIGLTSINIPPLVTALSYGVFEGCTSFTSFTIPSTVTSIRCGAFSGCTGLTTMIIPSSVISIGEFAFSGCTGLTSINIPPLVTALTDGVFEGCTCFTSFTIPSIITFIGNHTFEGCTGLTAINVDASNTNYTDVDGVLFNKNQTKLICYPAGKTDSTYTIPSTVTCIDSAAFYSSRLSSVIIPSSVNNIGNDAFLCSSKLSSIYAYPVTPVSFAAIECHTFGRVDTAHCVLHVPGASLADYKSANVWKSFKNIVGDISSGVASISADVKITVANGELQLVGVPSGESLGVYNTVGASIYTGKATGSALSISLPAHGVYVVQLGNASRKVMY